MGLCFCPNVYVCKIETQKDIGSPTSTKVRGCILTECQSRQLSTLFLPCSQSRPVNTGALASIASIVTYSTKNQEVTLIKNIHMHHVIFRYVHAMHQRDANLLLSHFEKHTLILMTHRGQLPMGSHEP
jgi:hypothetical protein